MFKRISFVWVSTSNGRPLRCVSVYVLLSIACSWTLEGYYNGTKKEDCSISDWWEKLSYPLKGCLSVHNTSCTVERLHACVCVEWCDTNI